MIRRRELEAKLALYQDLSDILGAMRSFALTELHRIDQREEAQAYTASVLFEALNDMAPSLPNKEEIEGDVLLLLGSVRGFCASFNEDILTFWLAQRRNAAATIVVGERLASIMPEDEQAVFVPGAVNCADAILVIERILSAHSQTVEVLGLNFGLAVVFRDIDGVHLKRMWPIQPENTRGAKELPLTNEPPAYVAVNVAQHCLFHMLNSLLLRSLHTENYMRLMQMESAVKHIDEKTEVLLSQKNRVRQEEIVNEIELILMKRSAP